MTTRVYFPSAGTPPVDTITQDAEWDVTSSMVRLPLVTDKTGTTVGARVVSGVTSGAAKDILVAQFVSETLLAQTISGTFTAVWSPSESGSGMNAWVRPIIRVIKADGTVRGTLFNAVDNVTPISTSGARNQEVTNNASTEIILTRIYPTQTLSSVTASAGDRIVVEVGARQWATSGGPFDFRLRIGDSTLVSDYALTANLNTSGTTWLEFSGDITFGAFLTPLTIVSVETSKRTFDFTDSVPGEGGALAYDLVQLSGPTTTITETTEGIFDVEFARPLTVPIVLSVTVTETGGTVVTETRTIGIDSLMQHLTFDGADWV